MVALVEIDQRLRDTEGYTVESPEGDVGRVEEVRFGDGGETYALDVELLDGSHTLLRADDVLAVDRDYRWVVVPSPPGGREDAPSEPVPSTAHPKPERPLWQVVALLYGTVALVVALVMLCAFLIAYAIAGAPY
jgi:hypothetical protein